MCGEGRSQSPIDIGETTPTALPELSPSYVPASLRIVHHEHEADEINTGHSIQVNLPGADTLTVGTDSFSLLQFHFHSPSEHTINGSHFPMEMHLVHRAEDGRLAVIGVMIEEGARNAAFDPIWENLPAEKGVERHLEDFKVEVDQLLPTSRTAYRYDGSLTTPPCSEGVRWFVMTSPIQLSKDQIDRFRQLIMGNNRPVQPLNGRSISADAMQ
jgi:carbonic anhydrase